MELPSFYEGFKKFIKKIKYMFTEKALEVLSLKNK